MRILALETSSRKATVALVDAGAPIVTLASETEGAHSEHLLPLLDRAIAESGWSRTSLDRIAVGVGPGSFTGIRVGVALATGIGLGLGRPVLGVGSLRAMARGVPADLPGLRCAALDARREELFVAVHTASGEERIAPATVPKNGILAWLAQHSPGPRVLVGEVFLGMGAEGWFESGLTDLPHATGVAWVAEGLSPDEAPAEPHYVRAADAVPSARRSPLSSKEGR